MARAKVTLQLAAAYKGPDGLKWKRGQTRTLSGATLEYYRHQSEFRVTDEVELSAPVPTKASEQVPESSSVSDETATFTEAELRKLSREELVDLAAEGFGLVLGPRDAKNKMIAAILEAQG